MRATLLSLLLLIVAVPGVGRADGMHVPGPDPAEYHLLPSLARAEALSRSSAGPSRLLGTPTQSQTDLSVEERRAIQERLKVRRAMAEAHQVLAFTTAGLIIAAEVFGVVNLVSLDRGDPTYRQLKPSLGVHRVLAGAAMGTYWASGVLAWAMPRAYNANLAGPTGRKKKTDSGELHAALSVAHGIGMATMLATGILMANVAENDAWEPLVVTHTAVGFTTAALVIGAGVVINTL
jgi:hypothetical protein